MDEQQFAEDVQAAMTAIVQAYEVMEAAERIYFARGWNISTLDKMRAKL
jgi:hypothetical protein